ncbi:phosphatidylinositol 4-phosphate 5-kinase-like protein 1 [Lytechinus pictus]|uniref:phosphatidylinositol 4-phosphate 5-kinase-like protein 1 n=1 Tax=Lytechinus pictus TaxID=7653 RepID=UPI0030BA09AD
MDNRPENDDGPKEKSSPRSSPSSSSRNYSRTFKQFVSDVRVKLKLRGLEEINDDHYLHSMSSAIRKGLQATIMNDQQENHEECLEDGDYCEFEERLITIENKTKEAVFRCYAPKVFGDLRTMLGISCREYNECLDKEPYLQYKSNSRSGQMFFMTNDKRYFLKTESRKDVKVLLRILPDYVTHLTKYPHSLLVRIHGLYFFKLPGKKGKFFTVMQSVFPTEEGNNRYDIKGCVLNRYVKPEKAGSQYVTVLKDVNFGDKKLHLQNQREWFLRQVDVDVEFLKQFNIMDYSLLIEQRALHSVEQANGGDLADLVIRVRKSTRKRRTRPTVDVINGHQRPSSTTGSNAGSTALDDMVELPGTVSCSGDPSLDDDIPDNHGTNVQYNKNVKGNQEMSKELEDFELGRVHSDSYKATAEGASSQTTLQEHNQRLLPNVHNAIHVVDGEKDRYFVGVIDILGQYTLKKRMETMLKSCLAPRTPFSSVSSEKYAKRFKDYIAAHTE